MVAPIFSAIARGGIEKETVCASGTSRISCESDGEILLPVLDYLIEQLTHALTLNYMEI